MELFTIARRYAQALFFIERDEDSADFLQNFALLVQHPMMLELINNNIVPCNQKSNIIIDLFDSLQNYQANFIKLLCHRKRLACVPLINKIFNQMLLAKKGIVSLKLDVADLSVVADSTILQDKLEQILHAKINLTINTNESLIGGARIIMQGHVIDGSIRSRLDSLRDALIT